MQPGRTLRSAPHPLSDQASPSSEPFGSIRFGRIVDASELAVVCHLRSGRGSRPREAVGPCMKSDQPHKVLHPGFCVRVPLTRPSSTPTHDVRDQVGHLNSGVHA